MQQLAIVGLNVGKQPDLFKQFIRQVLRFINDEHGFPATLDLLDQKLIDCRLDPQPVAPFDAKAEFSADGLHQLVHVHHRIEDEGGGIARIQLLQQRAGKRRLASADFASELHEALALTDAVEQVIDGFAVLLTVE